MPEKKTSVAIVYNHVGEDEFEKLRKVDPASLDFKPEYNIHVSTVREEYEAVAEALRSEGCDVKIVNVEEKLQILVDLLEKDPPDVVFNLVEFFHDDPKLEAMVAGLIDLYRVPYTGAPPFSLTLCQRKGLTKQVLHANGVPTPRFRLLLEPSIPRRHGLHYPLIVKPAREDASSGVDKEAVVYDLEKLDLRIQHVSEEYGLPILVEEFIEGREMHVGVLGNEGAQVLPMIEFDFSELPEDFPSIISYAAKWDPLKEEYHRIHTKCPAELPKRLEKRVAEKVLQAYKVTGCRDYARTDVRISKKNKIYILEVNPNPDLTEGVSFMESAEKAGYSFSQTLKMIVDFALSRRNASH